MTTAKLYGYQRAAVQRMVEQNATLLFDDMGLGKTLQVIEAIERSDAKPALLVVPKTLILNWKNEIVKWLPDEEPVVFNGDADQFLQMYMIHRAVREQTGSGSGYFIIWHDVLTKAVDTKTYYADEFAELILKVGWESIVVDEAHKFRNPDAYRTEALLGFKFTDNQKRFALTGTPIVNSAMDLYSLLKFVGMEQELPEPWVYRSNFTYQGPNGQSTGFRDKPGLMRLIGNRWIRRTKAQVLKDLPPKTEQVMHLEMSPDQRKAYDQMLQAFMLSLEDGGQIVIPAGPQEALVLMLRLRQLALDPMILHKRVASVKTETILELLDQHDSEEGGVLVLSNFTQYLNLLNTKLVENHHKTAIITGEQSIEERQAAVEAAQKGEAKVVLMNMAMSEGINLTECNLVIVADYWWNRQRMNQGIDRTHRIGQRRNVQVILLHADNSIDDNLEAIIAGKDATSKDLLISLVKHTMETQPDLLKKLGIDPKLVIE